MRIAVSACLCGVPCRYDGRSKPCSWVQELGTHHQLVPICPEVAGGLRIPHPANEIITSKETLCVMDTEGSDNTEAFVRGAQKTLDRVQSNNCQLAILKAKSPSCGNGNIYDGTFTGKLVAGYGVTANLLRSNGIRIMDEIQLKRCFEDHEAWLYGDVDCWHETADAD